MMFKCKYCGSEEYITKPLTGANTPNAIGLYCKKCNKWQKWLSKTERSLYAKIAVPPSNPCMYCGEEVPEGRHMCPTCEAALSRNVDNLAKAEMYSHQDVVKDVLKKILALAKGRKFVDFPELKAIADEVAFEYGFKFD